ncbi:EAL domain-containing protein [uncultured Thiodictyon sp.]|uniref:putative bifunctional diguanylate cyclase/phosphodiesterase n=1 Tax=uncultured Thiodictyon sp. TaxID=1846217 RepID=UPI0025D7C400|nr:EAL domain-containing protein [uncultured Thiodictyon sp.]
MSDPSAICAPAGTAPGRLPGTVPVLDDPGTWVLAVNFALLACYLLWVPFHWGGEARVALLADLADLVLSVSLFGLTWRASRSAGLNRRTRLGWRLLALGALAYWLGNLGWFGYEVLLGVNPFPSPADLGYLSFIPLVLAGLLCFIRPLESRSERVQFWLDVCVVMIGVGVMVWYFLLRPMAQVHYNSTLQLLLTQAPPLGDTALLVAAAALVLKRRRGRSGAPLAWLVAGLVCLFLADTRFAYQVLAGSYATGGLTDALYALAYCLMMVGPYLEYRIAAAGVPSVDGPSDWGAGLLPYLSVAGAYALLLLVAFGLVPEVPYVHWGDALGGLILAAAVLTVLVMVRQAVAAREIARLRAAQATRATQARFAALVRHSSDVISLMGPDRHIRFVSAAAQRVLGLAPAALTDTDLLDLLHPEDRRHAADFLRRVLASQAVTASTEWRLRHADGSWRDIETLATNLTADPTVGGVVLNSRDITERRRLEQRLRQLAFQDPLTGLANRTLFRDRVEHALIRAARSQGSLTLLYLDLDDFKAVNDSLGHAAGDTLLQVVAERLHQCARESDTVARLGGDELAILVEEPLPPAAAGALAERIAARLAEPIALGGREVPVRASIGIAQSVPTDGVDTLLGKADLAMYWVKHSGKQGYAQFEPAMQAAARERIDLELDLRHALECGEFLVYYQPIIHLPTNTLAGVEALVRWQHPRRGLLPPEVFIPLAEEKGELMVLLGRWALNQACGQARVWQDLLPAGMAWHVAVNISVRQFQQSDLVQDVADALERSGLDPQSLVLEITESTLMQGTAQALSQLTALKAQGVRLAIDDFGVGYSSLAYLHRFPMDILKLDKSFVDHLGAGHGDAPLTRAIVAIGAMLNLETVAEGVERPCQALELLRLGCPYVQGYLYAPPLDAAALGVQWIASHQDPYKPKKGS